MHEVELQTGASASTPAPAQTQQKVPATLLRSGGSPALNMLRGKSCADRMALLHAVTASTLLEYCPFPE